MKLYVCWGTFPEPWGHPCQKAHDALVDAGFRPDVKRAYGWKYLPGAVNRLTSGRREVEDLTGQQQVPVLVTDEGPVVAGSDAIVEWARAQRAVATTP